MYTCRVWLWHSLELKIALQIVLSDVQSIAGAQLGRHIRQHCRGVKVQLTCQLRSEIHRCKRRQRQRNTTENTCNQHATSVFEQRQIHCKTSSPRKSTVESKNSQYNAAIEHACFCCYCCLCVSDSLVLKLISVLVFISFSSQNFYFI